MNRRFIALLFAAAAFAAPAGGASALTTSTTRLTCSPAVKLQARIDAIPAGSVATILVSGTCNENITVPQGKTIIIRGATATARIKAANGRLPALVSNGDTTIRRMTVSNTTGSAEYLVGAGGGGQLNIVSSDLAAPSVGTVVAAWIGSVRVVNSRVVGGNNNALEVTGSSSLVVKGDPLYPAGPTGSFETYVRSKGAGVYCYRGGNFRIGTGLNSGSSGVVTIEQSAVGLKSEGCAFDFSNASGMKANIRIRANGTGIEVDKGTGTIRSATIAGNANAGIEVNQAALSVDNSDLTANEEGLNAEQSTVTISGAIISNNVQDVSSRYRGMIRFTAEAGPSSLPKATGWTSSFECSVDGMVVIGTGALVQSLGDTYNRCVSVE